MLRQIGQTMCVELYLHIAIDYWVGPGNRYESNDTNLVQWWFNYCVPHELKSGVTKVGISSMDKWLHPIDTVGWPRYLV